MRNETSFEPVTTFVVLGDINTAPVGVRGDNARRVLVLLDLDRDGFGSISGTELAARCRRRCWPEFRGDPTAGAMRDLLALAERAAALRVDVLYSGP